MKKLFFLAATAMLFAACSNEEVSTPQLAQDADDGGVRFDVYVPTATAQTRAGRTNVMTTTTLQKTGFGLFAYQTDNEGYVSPHAVKCIPNYMWNQQVYFNTAGAGWYYAPLKYWPNETKNDSQTTPTNPAAMPTQPTGANIDRLTFFAYAPWVSADKTTGYTSPINTDVEAPEETGIFRVSDQNGLLQSYSGDARNAIVHYKVATDPNQSVDLLWGVAPAGGLNYTSVAKGVTETGTVKDGIVSIPEGMPLINLIKPAVNTNLKFMFQHALARLGVKVVLAVDQVASGGSFDYGNTKVTIEKIEISGKFGTNGLLDLNNGTANTANWIVKNTADGATPADKNPVLTIAKNTGLAPHLVFDKDKFDASPKEQQEVTGVTTDLADAIKVSSTYDPNYPDEYGKVESKPAYSPTTPYFEKGVYAKSANYEDTYYEPYEYTAVSGATYFYKHETNKGVSYTAFTPNLRYPYATVWKNVYTLPTSHMIRIDGSTYKKEDWKNYTAYRKVGNTYTQTGREPETGDWILGNSNTSEKPDNTPAAIPAATTKSYYIANPNYFMVIPTNSAVDNDKTLKVKITYYVSTTDESVADEVVYTKNVVEKDIVLPHLKNGVAYNLKLILGLTSVKVEAEVADWTTTEGVVNLPQNTSE